MGAVVAVAVAFAVVTELSIAIINSKLLAEWLVQVIMLVQVLDKSATQE